MPRFTSKVLYQRLESPIIIVTAGEIILEVNPSYVHNFAGVVFYSDAEGTTVVQPTAGTITVTAKVAVQPQDFQDLTNGLIDATAPGQADWEGNTNTVKATFAGITGATHAQLFVSGNSA